MIRITPFIFSLLFFFQLNAQTPNFFIEYYPVIDHAERYIMEEKYGEALGLYKKAFDKVKVGFARDYHNAILCAIEVNDTEFAFEYLEKLVSKGVELRWFQRNEDYYKPLLNLPKWKRFIENYDLIKASNFDITFDYEYAGKLGEMFNRDQKVREGANPDFQKIKEVDLENLAIFRELIERKGFPTEEMLGVFTPNANLIDLHIQIVHHQKNHKADSTLFDLNLILFLAVRNGKLHAEQAAEYFDIAGSSIGGIGKYGTTGVIKLRGEEGFYKIKYSDDDLKTINLNRRNLGLSPRDIYIEKIIFQRTNKNTKFDLCPTSGYSTYPIELKDMMDLEKININ